MVYRYYVEGGSEKKLIDEFKAINKAPKFIPGKVIVFNVLCDEFTLNQLRDITETTTIIFVYDTDSVEQDKKERLKRNIEIVSSIKRVKKIIHVQSVNNFEDEILYSSDVKTIDEIFKTQGSNAFKKEFIACSNIQSKFKSINFDFDKLWSRKSKDKYFASLLDENGGDIKK